MKGCSRKSSNGGRGGLGKVGGLSALNEGLLSKEQQPQLGADPTSLVPTLNEGLLSKEQQLLISLRHLMQRR